MKTGLFTVMAGVIIMSLVSCQKDTSDIEQAALNMADDDAVMDQIFEDVYNTTDNATIQAEDISKGSGAKDLVVVSDSCPTITIDHPEQGIWPKVITVDFGEGCTGFYDNTRSGKIIITVTAPRIETGSVRTVTFDNYKFNGILVEGTKVVENMGPNDNQNIVFNVTLAGGKITLPDGKFIERSYSHQREWIAGFNTRNIWDDECLVTGTGSGTTLGGVAYTNTITTALHWQRACFFLVGGVMTIEREGKDDVTIDFGQGTCDNKAVITSGGVSREISLKAKIRTMTR
jgi:hypothetical protein